MNKKEVDSHRYIVQSRLEESAINQASQGSDIKHIFEKLSLMGKNLDEVKVLVKEQNGRVRSVEGDMSAFKAIGAMISVMFSSLFAYLFTRS
jgi:hypothetical protein|tara:strand:- start:138 stop:413 length:276 start_codon:yes stop_codon:yes gene_type:complete